MSDSRPCTCAPDERPHQCQHQYALGLCLKAENRSLRIELDRLIEQIVDLTKLRLEDELVHGNVMGRIAVALFGDQNNRTDEECVARAAEIGYQLTGTQEALFQAQEASKMLASEVAALRDQEEFNETALKGYRNNIDDLKHDIARHVEIAATQAQELEELRADLVAKDATLGEMTALARKAEAALATARSQNQECNLLLSRVLHELAGSASLCWEPKPTGVFATELALGFVEDAIDELRAALAGEKK